MSFWTWNTLFTGMVMLIMLLSETLRLRKKKHAFREWVIFFGFWLFASAAAIGQVIHAPLPNPLDWLTPIYEPITKSIFHLLE